MKMTGAEMIVAALQAEEVDVIFGYPGGKVLNLYDAFYDSSIQHYLSDMNRGPSMR